jgi:hypothetical protein
LAEFGVAAYSTSGNSDSELGAIAGSILGGKFDADEDDSEDEEYVALPNG